MPERSPHEVHMGSPFAHPHPGLPPSDSSLCLFLCDDFLASARMRHCALHTGAGKEVTHGQQAIIT